MICEIGRLSAAGVVPVVVLDNAKDVAPSTSSCSRINRSCPTIIRMERGRSRLTRARRHGIRILMGLLHQQKRTFHLERPFLLVADEWREKRCGSAGRILRCENTVPSRFMRKFICRLRQT